MVRRPLATSNVRDEWLRRVEAEYASAAIAQHLTLWLTQVGASADLVQAGLRIAWDEMIHARMSHRVYRAAGGENVPSLVREKLCLIRDASSPLEHDVVRAAVGTFCIGETVAVPLFQKLRKACAVPIARRTLDRVLRDEVRHRDFGWTLLSSMLEGADHDALRAVAEAALASGFVEVRSLYGHAGGVALSASETAWGLMPTETYGAVVDATLDRAWIPRFAKVGIDARIAWDRASRTLASSGRKKPFELRA